MKGLWEGKAHVLAAAVLWSTSGFFAKSIQLPALVMACFRGLFAGLFLCALIPRGSMTFRPAVWGMLLCFATMNVAFITAMTLTTAANVIFLQYTAPLWMAVFGAVFLKEKLERRNVVALLIAGTGIAVILWGEGVGMSLGIPLALLAGVMYGAVAVFLRHLREEEPAWLTTVNLLGSGVILVPFLVVTVPLGRMLSGNELLWLAAFGILQMGIPYLLFAKGMRTVKAQDAGIITLVEPVLNPIIAFFAVGERASLTSWIGGAFLLVSVTIGMERSKPKLRQKLSGV